MTALSLFAICIALTLIFLFGMLLLLGQGIYMLALIFPAHAADVFTRRSRLNIGSRTVLYTAILGFFILMEILLIAGIFFGLACLIFGYPATNHPVQEITKVYSLAELTRLLYINKILLLLEAYFMLMFTYYSIKHKEQYATMKGFLFFSYRILPIISFPLAFIYLIGTLGYLSNYSTEKTMHVFPLIAGYIYAAYSVYAFGKSLFMYSRTLRYGASGLTAKYWINFAISVLYNALFLYFFFQIQTSV